MKKPKHAQFTAGRRIAEDLGCKLNTKVVVITKADFERLFKLAKLAVQLEQGSNSGREES